MEPDVESADVVEDDGAVSRASGHDPLVGGVESEAVDLRRVGLDFRRGGLGRRIALVPEDEHLVVADGAKEVGMD